MNPQRGMILLIVMWVLLILTVIAWTYARQSQMELKMTGFQTDSVRAYYLARAGVARAMVYLREDKLKDMGVLGDDSLIEVDDKDENWVYDAPAEAWGYNPDAYGFDPDEDDEEKIGTEIETARGKFYVRVFDISGNMNLNFARVENVQHLLEILGVEEDYAMALAAAIVDYVDADDQPTIIDEKDIDGWEFGEPLNEDYYYNPHQDPAEIDAFGPEIIMKNAPLNAVEELLLVPGMTEVIFRGEDANGNGELDDNEDDGDETPPFDNEDGELQLGLKDFITVFSGMSEERLGKPNINSAPLEVIEALLWVEDDAGDGAEGAAEKLVDYRNGSDGFLGSDDDKRFRTIDHTDEGSEGIDKSGIDPSYQSLATQAFGVASDYFRIESTAIVNKVKKTLKVTVLRTFTEEVQLGGSDRFEFQRDQIQEEQVKLLVIDFEEVG
ncbi:MAG: general secretion pathway protein GspK [Candidatus Omnitrophica bacterium]|nr:general secretion pathway protein GspK [Candidatus Omnitrophota bacterium]